MKQTPTAASAAKQHSPRHAKPASRRLTLALGFGLMFCAATAHAATITVSNTNDAGLGSLRQAIADSAAGGTVDFASTVTGTIALTSAELVVNKSLTILGPGPDVLEISGSNARRVFNVSFEPSEVTISGLTITEGQANVGAGIYNNALLTLSQCVVFNNHTTINGEGGGIFSTGNMNMSDCVVYLNDAAAGGGVRIGGLFASSLTVNITRSYIHSNNATIEGGGILAVNTLLSMDDSTVAGNGVNSSSGTIATFSNVLGGGGLGLIAGSATLSNCTISGNSVSASALASGGKLAGGGIANDGGLVLHNCTVADNHVLSTSTSATIPNQGGGIYTNSNSAVSATIGGTIVARNTATTGPDFSGPATSQGFNLISKRDGSTGFTQPTDLTGAIATPFESKLASGLQSNEGSTPTYLLLTGSPAIDKGKSFGLATDQRGKPRPVDHMGINNASGGDGSDIGAVEVDTQFAFVNNPNAVKEGTAAAPASVTFTITLSTPVATRRTVTLNYQTANGTATAGSDYVAQAGTLTFAPGESLKRVTVDFIGDNVAEPTETFYLDLKTPVNAAIADSRGVAYIGNEDGPQIVIDNARAISEGQTGFTLQQFIVRLSAASTNTITVNWATGNGPATGGAGPADFTVATGTLTFAPGETTKTIAIQVKGDTTVEPTEKYFVNLTRPTFAIIADSQGSGFIINDDSAPGLIIQDTPSG